MKLYHMNLFILFFKSVFIGILYWIINTPWNWSDSNFFARHLFTVNMVKLIQYEILQFQSK